MPERDSRMNEETTLPVPLERTAEDRLQPAVHFSEEEAAKIVEALEIIAARMPDLEIPHPSTSRRVRGARTIPRELVAAMIDTVEISPGFRAIGTFDAAAAREALQAIDARRKVAVRLATLLEHINYTNEAQWARLATAATQTLTIAGLRAKRPDGAELVSHVKRLRKILGRKSVGRPKKGRGEEE